MALVKFRRQDALMIFYRLEDEIRNPEKIRAEIDKLLEAYDGQVITRNRILEMLVGLLAAEQLLAVCCARGMMELLGRKVEKGEEVLVDITLTEVKEAEGHG